MPCIHYFSLFNPSHRPYRSACTCFYLWCNTWHPPHLILHITHRWTYCLNYNQIKCGYGCAWLQIPLLFFLPFLACGPDFFFSLNLSTGLFLPKKKEKKNPSNMLFHLVFSSVSKGMVRFQLKQKKKTLQNVWFHWQIVLCQKGISRFYEPVNQACTASPDNLFSFTRSREPLKLN